MGTTTRQRDVEPGDQTGTYYITICNLPFETSWQELKDYIRPQCEVEHVQIFRSSTSGWVRVRGRENFEKAWGLLDGGLFKGRSIIASDRNRTETIKIKEPIDTGSMTENLTFPQMVPAAVQVMSTDHVAALYPMAFPTFSLPGAMTVAAPGVGLGNLSTNDMSQGSPGGFVVTEPRKALVTQLGNGARVDEIKSWIHKRAGTYANTISSIEVPCKRSSTEARGHAYIIFETVSAAAHAIKLLDASRFKGRQVSARLTTEGLSGGSGGVSKQGLRQDKDGKKSSKPEA